MTPEHNQMVKNLKRLGMTIQKLLRDYPGMTLNDDFTVRLNELLDYIESL